MSVIHIECLKRFNHTPLMLCGLQGWDIPVTRAQEFVTCDKCQEWLAEGRRLFAVEQAARRKRQTAEGRRQAAVRRRARATKKMDVSLLLARHGVSDKAEWAHYLRTRVGAWDGYASQSQVSVRVDYVTAYEESADEWPDIPPRLDLLQAMIWLELPAREQPAK